ncbi:helix-turn-helix transcriptional regulator [Paenibacillus alvei]|uniref:Helix-turn-helix transcriptional regulator n=1 Tax=Paenibacillus alvei TaxID=44250 RepID=A0AAP7DKC9_PAEAL|nr:AraC family transcriptional regulator [Paenibacillus alvei]NOJ73763.1 helix-turn-helix transcriptional regulator [Paenibacillus alvei]
MTEERKLDGRGAELASDVILFRSEQEMRAHLPCKMYKINQTLGSIWDHTHDYIQIWYVVKGEFKHSIHHRTYNMVKGNLFVIPPYAVHRVDMIPGQEMEVIGCEFLPHFINERFEQSEWSQECFDFSYLEKFLIDEKQVTPKIALTGDSDMEVARLLTEMLEEYGHSNRFFELMLKANLLKLLSVIIREYSKLADRPSEEDEWVEKYRGLMNAVMEYIHGHFAEELRLERLCRQFNISKTYFCHLFKRFTGKTFNDYLINLRVNKAAEWLIETNMSVTEICFGSGFNDLAYFSRIFKRYTGMAPSQFKKKALADRLS